MFAKLAIIASAIATLTAAAPQNIQKRAVGLVSSCEVSGQVALTFDDGPYIWEPTVANNLQGNKGTFFLNGNNYACIYDHAEEIQALHAAGHTIGSHTWSHPDMTTLSYNDAVYQIEHLEEAFIKILGLKPKYFRPPYGSYNDQLLGILSDRGYTKVILWSDDTGDSTGASVDQQQGVIEDVRGSYPNPHLVLMHSTQDTTANQVVPYAVDRLSSAGYQLVAVDTCLGSDGEWPYYWIGQPGTRDDSWHC